MVAQTHTHTHTHTCAHFTSSHVRIEGGRKEGLSPPLVFDDGWDKATLKEGEGREKK